MEERQDAFAKALMIITLRSCEQSGGPAQVWAADPALRSWASGLAL